MCDDGGLTEGGEEVDEEFGDEKDGEKLEEKEGPIVSGCRGICDEVCGDDHREEGREGGEWEVEMK